MAETPIKDENLRLVLSKGHEDYLLQRIQERNFMNGVLVGIWLAVPILLLFMDSMPAWLGFIIIIVLLSTPFALIAIAANQWVVYKHWRYYLEHNKFLEKYKRSANPSMLKATRTRNISMMRGGLAALTIVLAALSAVPLFATVNNDRHVAKTEDEDCIVYISEHSDPEAEMAIRSAKFPKCGDIEIRDSR